MEDVAIKILDIPLDLQKMTGPDGVSLKNTRLVDQLQARKTVIMKECNEGLARLSFIFDFNH